MKSAQDFKTITEYNGYLRKYFAAMAMQGLLAKEGWSERFVNEVLLSIITI